MNARAVLQLCRIPNVFTAFADVTAGALLARGGALAPADAWVVGASGALYAAGMVLNDFFDRHVDALERPGRPIPSGRIGAPVAGVLGFALLGLGLALASFAGARSLAVAALLALAVVLYDAFLKSSAVGPAAMGACRFLNVSLGLSVAPWGTPWVLVAPAVLGAFTAGITRLSRHEVGGAAPSGLRATLGGLAVLAVALGLGAWALGTAAQPAFFRSPGQLVTLAIYGFVVARGVSLFGPLRHAATPPLLGRAIGGGILLMPAIDATSVAASGAPLGALAVLALSVPAHVLKRWYYLT